MNSVSNLPQRLQHTIHIPKLLAIEITCIWGFDKTLFPEVKIPKRLLDYFEVGFLLKQPQKHDILFVTNC